MIKKRHTSKPDQNSTSAVQRKREAKKREARKRRSIQKFNIAWLYIGLGLVVVVAAAFLLLQPKEELSSEIPASQAFEKYQGGDFFMDVRDQQEWDQGHITGSTHIPLENLQSRLEELPRDRDIVVVCTSGKRSKTGMAILQQAGFDRVTCLSGGMQAWVSAGYPLEKSGN